MAPPILSIDAQSVMQKWVRLLNAYANELCSLADRFKYTLLATSTVAYFAVTVFRASRKLFWYDEIFTVSISRLPSLKSVWDALLLGVDFNPPLFYAITRWSDRFPLNELVRSRMPEVLGFWVFCLCLFRFVCRHTNVPSALITLLFPMATTAYWYSFDARPHAIVLGFFGIALVCWQATVSECSGLGRVFALLGMGMALAGALLTHSYAFLVFVPIVVGELIRALRLRRIDWPVWIVTSIAASALLVSVPLLRAVHSADPTYNFYPANLAALMQTYRALFAPAMIVLGGWLALMYVAPQSDRMTQPRIPGHEIAAIVATLTVPLFAYLAGKLTHAPLIPRYSLCTTAGLACLIGLAVRRRPGAAIVTLLLLVGTIGLDFRTFVFSTVISEPTGGRPIAKASPAFSERYRWMENFPDKTLPILLPDVLDFVPTIYYAPARLQPRLIHVILSTWDGNGKLYAKLQECCDPTQDHIARAPEFFASHPSFLVYGGLYTTTVIQDFIHSGAKVTIENIDADQSLALVTLSQKTGETTR